MAFRQPLATRIGIAGRRVPGVRWALETRVKLMHARWERRYGPRDAQMLRSLAGRTDLRLNIGSNTGEVGGWINIDILRDPEGRIFRMDATKPWPFAEGSAEAVNAEHVIEHIDPADVPAFLREAHRALRPGGVLRLSTPSLAGLMAVYAERRPEDLQAHRAEGYVASDHADLVNNYFYLWEHRHIYDASSLARLLGEAGFAQVEEVVFGSSRHDVLRGVDVHDMGALQRLAVGVDAVRP